MAAPVDRRLVRESRAARTHLIVASGLGVLQAGLILAQAVLLATVIARSATRAVSLASLKGELIALAAVIVARAAVTAGFELSGRLGATRVMSDLRLRLARRLLLASPGERPSGERTGELAAAAVQGVDALEAYFAGYLPQLVLASVVPVAVLAFVLTVDPISAVILAVTVPILIVFMVLIGKGAQATTNKRWQALSLLSAHFLDVLRGLPTLRAYRRERAQHEALEAVGERYRAETMATLRIAFLSSFVLELCAMIGTAMVAATIGVQLVGGSLTLAAGLTVLLLAPELYGPLRQVGQQFHASADGVAASERIFAALDEPVPVAAPAAPVALPDPSLEPVRLRAVSYEYAQRPGAVLRDVDLELAPRRITALVGPSGGGKSTIARLLLRLADPSSGAVRCGETDLRDVDLDAWRRQIAWVPQRPKLFTGTVADNIRLAAPHADDRAVREAVDAAGATELVAGLRDGLDTLVGEGSRRLSAGQCQRIALARAFLSDAPLLVLDEPTSHLDEASAAAVGETIERLARGRTTLLIVHHESLARRADTILTVSGGRVAPAGALVELAA
ncbi:MAG TPA: thiol reductant ABC exporter subunit CydD [Solirubrobacteraceae bacterium]|nr:thiol reductant ABC exporter subunit CydD [Solirubrobacteraceae bacterium]